MNLTDLHSVSARLDAIEKQFWRPSPEAQGEGRGREVIELDRFFWLRAQKTANGEPEHTFFSALCPDRKDTCSGSYRICNLVLQGGGTLGLAHAGFIAGLERAGVRFAGLAGTSAGSILAMGLAAIRGHDLTRQTHEVLISIAESVPMDHFIDGPRPIRKLIKGALKKRQIYMPHHWYGWLMAVKRLRDRRGLNQGAVFEAWLETVLTELGFGTIGDLYSALDTIWQSLRDPENWQLDGADAALYPFFEDEPDASENGDGMKGARLLQLITTAMPVGSKFKFPEDLRFLSREYENMSPAKLVRTSMSIPAFFEPVPLRTRNGRWRRHVETNLAGLLSRDQADSFAELEELVFLDGGMVSNLPSDAFRDLLPSVPTIVVPLVSNTEKRSASRRRNLASLKEDLVSCASAIRLQRDREIWLQNAELRNGFVADEDRRTEDCPERARKYNVEIAPIDTRKANWLNFAMSDAEKVDLFEAGLTQAESLLASLNSTESRQARTVI